MPFLSFLTFTNLGYTGMRRGVSTRFVLWPVELKPGKRFRFDHVVVNVRVQARYPPASTTTMVHIGNVSATGLTLAMHVAARSEVRVVCVWVSRALILVLRVDRPFRGLGLGRVIFGAACSSRERFSHVKAPFFFDSSRCLQHTQSELLKARDQETTL